MSFAFRRSTASLAGLLLSTTIVLAQDADTITVYNAQHVSLTQEWAAAFTKETGIKITQRNGSDMELGNQIVQEGKNSPADVFLTENSPAISLVDSAGLLAKVSPETLAMVDENYRPSSGNWVGIAARSTVFAYNTAKVKRRRNCRNPSWTSPIRSGRAGGLHLLQGADFQAIVTAILELKGQPATAAWLKAMKVNAKPFNGNNAALRGVNAGQVDGAVIYHYYYFGDQAKTGENTKNVALHYFKNQDPGAFVSVSGGGVLASSKKQEKAQTFVKWILSKTGQSILTNGSAFEYAVAKDAASNAALPPLVSLQAPKVDPAKLNNKTVTDLMVAAGLL